MPSPPCAGIKHGLKNLKRPEALEQILKPKAKERQKESGGAVVQKSEKLVLATNYNCLIISHLPIVLKLVRNPF